MRVGTLSLSISIIVSVYEGKAMISSGSGSATTAGISGVRR